MAYNNYFPTGYQPYPFSTPYYSQFAAQDMAPAMGQANTQPVQNRAVNGIIWVSGEAGARGYPVAPNQTVQLWDSEAQCIYLKSADASGMPTIKTLDYTIRETTNSNALKQSVDLSGYITRDEFEKKLAELKGEHHESDLSAVWKTDEHAGI